MFITTQRLDAALMSSIKEPVPVNFNSMTIRELRTHIKENKLHQKIRDRLGKTVSNACKHELIEALS
ncbi:MAG: hypothetical protein HC939_23825 [Pleurocapsa sp. SU_5_0]|nr:hypothetical protein [Pleurocapsa sp. SU_5_0]NJO98087.1 hypothetical protein [Pleurocapsa sp. CRU_1_2]